MSVQYIRKQVLFCHYPFDPTRPDQITWSCSDTEDDDGDNDRSRADSAGKLCNSYTNINMCKTRAIERIRKGKRKEKSYLLSDLIKCRILLNPPLPSQLNPLNHQRENFDVRSTAGSRVDGTWNILRLNNDRYS